MTWRSWLWLARSIASIWQERKNSRDFRWKKFDHRIYKLNFNLNHLSLLLIALVTWAIYLKLQCEESFQETLSFCMTWHNFIFSPKKFVCKTVLSFYFYFCVFVFFVFFVFLCAVADVELVVISPQGHLLLSDKTFFGSGMV